MLPFCLELLSKSTDGFSVELSIHRDVGDEVQCTCSSVLAFIQFGLCFCCKTLVPGSPEEGIIDGGDFSAIFLQDRTKQSKFTFQEKIESRVMDRVLNILQYSFLHHYLLPKPHDYPACFGEYPSDLFIYLLCSEAVYQRSFSVTGWETATLCFTYCPSQSSKVMQS